MAKVKLSDIAKEAGVSVATVSYVLNNNPNQKINEKTKRQILQIASLLGYTKNSFASALANGKSNQIGIYVENHTFPLHKAELYSFVQRLVETLKLNNYNAILLPNAYSKSVDYADAIICIGISDEDFVTIAKNNIIPVIAVDTKAHVPWIFEIKNTFGDISEKLLLKEYTLITYECNSHSYKAEIEKKNSNVIYISSFSQLNNLKEKIKDKKVVIAGEELYEFSKMLGMNADKYPIDIQAKINKILDCLRYSIDHIPMETHEFNL